MNGHRSSRAGFTLVEVLVVVLIMAALASLAIAGWRRARAASYMMLSTDRIKGLGAANAIYATEHNGSYVPILSFDGNGQAGVMWHFNADFLGPLIGDTEFLNGVTGYEGIGGMPEAVLDPLAVRAKKRFSDRISASYGYNDENIPLPYVSGGRNQKAQQSVVRMSTPARMMNFITATDYLVRFDGRSSWLANPVEGKTDNGQIAYRHNNKAIAVFYDGHSELLSNEDIRRFDKLGGVSSVFWGGSR